MTSDVLRKVLVAGAAVAALSVAACSKPADKTDAAAPAADASPAPAADAASGNAVDAGNAMAAAPGNTTP
jgi:predicted outer membrane protein